MTEHMGDLLGDQRLLVSQALGDDFTSGLEGSSADSPLVVKVRLYLLEHPGTQIIGAKIEENTGLPDIIKSLSTQMGLPENSNLGNIKDRLYGREKSFILVFPGFNNLLPKEQKNIQKKLKMLKVGIFTDST